MNFMAGGNAYSLLHEHKNGWNPEAFRERFSEVLERFDYVVGDWGYSQLRLRGFYRDGHPKATKDSTISSLVDYINEYCNFGCAYFVLGKLDSANLSDEQKSALQVLPEISAALNEAGEQVAETAAALSGPLMRWPLKERAGGPARAPNVTVSAVARAAESAERRNAANQNLNASGSSNRGGGSNSRQGQDGGNSNRGRSYGGPSGAERRQGQAGGPSAGKSSVQQRGARVQAGGEAGNSSNEDTRFSEGGNIRPDGSKNGSRWPGKNRRRKTFGGKPNHRAESAPRPDNGSTRSGE